MSTVVDRPPPPVPPRPTPDREDIEGHPFVGPAGGVLDRGLRDAGIETGDVYITNVVKHFRYKARGQRRIHQKLISDLKQVAEWLSAR